MSYLPLKHCWCTWFSHKGELWCATVPTKKTLSKIISSSYTDEPNDTSFQHTTREDVETWSMWVSTESGELKSRTFKNSVLNLCSHFRVSPDEKIKPTGLFL